MFCWGSVRWYDAEGCQGRRPSEMLPALCVCMLYLYVDDEQIHTADD